MTAVHRIEWDYSGRFTAEGFRLQVLVGGVDQGVLDLASTERSREIGVPEGSQVSVLVKTLADGGRESAPAQVDFTAEQRPVDPPPPPPPEPVDPPSNLRQTFVRFE